jgi:CRISPR-associated protein Cmr2
VSEALSDFTRRVEELFTGPGAVDGLAIYAGGDDVLALTTLEAAIRAAVRLADAYRESFRKQGVTTDKGETPGISAAIVFADHHEPFRDVAKQAHDMLGSIAKRANGRASLAVGVQKPSGPAAQWVGKWQLSDGTKPPGLLIELAKRRRFSGRFPYNLRTRYLDPAGKDFHRIEFKNAELKEIFGYELGKSREASTRPETGEIADMLTVCRPVGAGEDRGDDGETAAGLDVGGLLLVRFLEQYGIWR